MEEEKQNILQEKKKYGKKIYRKENINGNRGGEEDRSPSVHNSLICGRQYFNEKLLISKK